MYFSKYEDRIAHTPSEESNRWEGKRGESCCLPCSEDSKSILEAKGIKGIEYKNGEPDFAPVSESTVKIGYMNEERYNKDVVDGRDSKNTTYVHYGENDQVESRTHQADKNSNSDINMKYYNPGNFNQADILTAEEWSRESHDGKEWSADDVAQYRRENNLTWHECNDGETMMLIPSEVNSDFSHLGGVGEIKRRNEIIDEINEEYDTMLPEDDEVNEELLRARRESGYDYMDDEEKADFDELFHILKEHEKYDIDSETDEIEDSEFVRDR